MPKNWHARLQRLEHNLQRVRRSGGVIHLAAGESLAERLALLPVGGQYLVIDEPTARDYELATGPGA